MLPFLLNSTDCEPEFLPSFKAGLNFLDSTERLDLIDSTDFSLTETGLLSSFSSEDGLSSIALRKYFSREYEVILGPGKTTFYVLI